MLTVEKIKEKYPSPRSCYDASGLPDHYCVGGAFCKMIDVGLSSFPGAYTLAPWLRSVNPGLSVSKAIDYASSITRSNDANNFDAAWKYLDEALSYYPTMSELLEAKND